MRDCGKMVYAVLVASLITVFTHVSANASNWYVDKNASGPNNGTSWDNAWTSFSAINWSNISSNLPAIIYISGGTTSKTYTERLTIGASGTNNSNRITIRAGQDAGHTGTVILDDNWTDYSTVNIGGKNYVTINGAGTDGATQKIQVVHAQYVGVYVNGDCMGVEISYLDINNNGDHIGALGGINATVVEKPGALEIHHNKIHDNQEIQAYFGPSGSTKYDGSGVILFHHNEVYNIVADGIQGYINGLDVYNNTIHDRMTAKFDYTDFIQWFGANFKWYNNTSYRIARDYNNTQPLAWQPNTQYRYGDMVSPTGANSTKRYFVNGSAAGGLCTSGSAEPAWNYTYASHTTDGTCDWRNRMMIANDDGTWWPTDWAVNAHVKYSPDGGPGHDPRPRNVWIYNNLLYENDLPRCLTKGCTAGRGFEMSLADSTLTNVDDIYILNNTIFGMPLNAITIGFAMGTNNVNNVYIENNLVSQCGGADPGNSVPIQTNKDPSKTVTYGSHGQAVDVVVDYNLFYADGSHSNKFLGDGVSYSCSSYNTSFANVHGLCSNPLLAGNFVPRAGSPAIDRGVSLNSYFSTDKFDVIRPLGYGWDIGAYEGISTPKTPLPPSIVEVK